MADIGPGTIAIILGVITAFAFVAALVALRIIGRQLNPPDDYLGDQITKGEWPE